MDWRFNGWTELGQMRRGAVVRDGGRRGLPDEARLIDGGGCLSHAGCTRFGRMVYPCGCGYGGPKQLSSLAALARHRLPSGFLQEQHQVIRASRFMNKIQSYNFESTKCPSGHKALHSQSLIRISLLIILVVCHESCTTPAVIL